MQLFLSLYMTPILCSLTFENDMFKKWSNVLNNDIFLLIYENVTTVILIVLWTTFTCKMEGKEILKI
jgi:hypothetical protein